MTSRTVYVVQQKRTGRSKWADDFDYTYGDVDGFGEGSGYSSKAKALKAVKEARMEVAEDSRYDRQTRDSVTSVAIDAEMTLDQAIEKVKAAHGKLKPVKPVDQSKLYPQFRIVARTLTDEVVDEK